ncbi:TIGR01212 family radical SAM protein [Thalassotalea sp. G2M2-11]|uniref:TIGR01212 family radical SAM protein n=1 Tax=Thalassotalea sp. G2M2-11 TaxID=2787627 RepID=UPI0019CFFB94|nr:TIGR01212 family radical SAM protein [Thalassotalea sp. G2M2-11]
MQLDNYVNTFGRYLKQTYQQRVKKLTIDAAFTCPNRDGTLGRGGCTFCNVKSFNQASNEQSIAKQINQGKAEHGKKSEKYLAYFQAYTSTYQEVEYLREKYQQALSQADIIGLCVGTRPDCVPDEVLELLQEYVKQGYEVWLELGLQSSSNKTLKRINRGHEFSAYQDAVERAARYGIKICTHLIIGLPGEQLAESMTTLEQVLNHPLDGLKLHPLHIVKGSIMAKAWQAQRMKVLSMTEYADIAGELIRHTPPSIIFHRVSATAHKHELLAPDWCLLRWPSINEVCKNLDRLGGQGAALSKENTVTQELTLSIPIKEIRA